MKKYLFIGLWIFTSIVPNSFAKRFSNEYSEFQLPQGWECALEGSEWVCQSVNPERKKEAIIILVAKKRGPQDSLANYESYLKGSKTYSLPGGKTQVSEPKIVSIKKLHDHEWVDALHLASEVPGYYTRYLATVKEDLGVAITFSVSKDHYDSYKEVFDSVVAGLRVFRQAASKLAFEQVNGSGNSSVLDQIQIPEDSTLDINTGSGSNGKAQAASSSDDNMMMLAAVLVIGALAFIVIKKKKQQASGAKKSAKKKSVK